MGIANAHLGAREGASMVLGTISVLTWAVAEIPQIIANYNQKSTAGLSLAFLVTWIIGDLLNVVGCWLEPATLATQFYMALLFTATSFVLTGQKIYYGYFCYNQDGEEMQFAEGSRSQLDEKVRKQSQTEHAIGRKLMEGNSGSSGNQDIAQTSSAISYRSSAFAFPRFSPSTDAGFFFKSARSLSRSPNTAAMPFLLSRDLGHVSASYQEHSMREPFLSKHVYKQFTPPANTKNMLCVVSSSIFLLGCLRIHFSQRESSVGHVYVVPVGRKLLEDAYGVPSATHIDGSDSIGSYLGWGMAVVYMGGRLPQIILNIKRGHAEGLSPLMFAFALLGNGTYIASILVKSLDWSVIKPNLPWLVDACGCVLLDIFILIQFSYFQYKKRRTVLK